MTKKSKPAGLPKHGSADTGTSIEVRHLRYATAAGSHGSFRKAAQAIGVKQSTLSRTIAQMETRLGVRLFERTSGGVRLTEAGAGIIQTSRYLVDTIDIMTVNANALNRGHIGQLSIGFYTPLSSGNLRASLTEFAGKFPDVEIRTVEASRSRLISNLECGSIDIAVVTGAPSLEGDTAMVLWTERILAALPEGHPLTAKNMIHWTDLKDETLLLSEYDPGPELHNVLASKLSDFEDGLKIKLHRMGQENIKGLVGAGFGISLIIEAGLGATYPGAVYREVRDGNGPSRISYAAHWRGDNRNPTLSNFIALLEERYPSSRCLDLRHCAAPSQTPDPSP
ncbi:DNA-binding transcriptional LysR family regulator [Labrenzia sp. EL_195]|nr:DNA-binding transcriptional LysR family regulator [Labrenzia sp. EL_195]